MARWPSASRSSGALRAHAGWGATACRGVRGGRLRAWGLASIFVALVAAATGGSNAVAQLNEGKPKELEGVGVTEHPDVQIPLDLEFVDVLGKKTTLGDCFDGGKPIVLTMNYSNCPRLCSVQLNALVDAMRKMPWDLGEEYRVVTVSFDPLETPERANLTKQKYIQMYGRPGAAAGWDFLVGEEANIQKLAQTVGFNYVFRDGQYIHVAVLMICTPDAHLSRYLYGVEYDPQTLRLSLVEAGEGKVGSPMDQVLLYCFHYDPASRRYGPAAFNLMRAGGLLTIVVVGGVLSVYWMRERKKRRHAPPEEAPQETS